MDLWWMIEHAAEQLVAYCKEAVDHCHLSEFPKSCVPHDRFWQRPAWIHVVEFVVINLVAVLIGVVGWWWIDTNRSSRRLVGPRDRERRRSHFQHLLGVVLLVLLALQVWFKTMRPTGYLLADYLPRDIIWMTMPCHVYTILAATALLSPSRAVSTHLASLCVTLAWNTYLGSAFADFTDQTHWLEPYAFIAQHGILNFLPLYFVMAYPIHDFTAGWFLWTTSLMTLWNMAVHTPLSYWSGYNINYHIHPPIRGLPNDLFGTDMYYRPKIIIILMLLSTASHFIVTSIGHLLDRLLHGKQKME